MDKVTRPYVSGRRSAQPLGVTQGIRKMQGVPYLAKLSGEAAARHDLGEIRTAIDSIGYWERHDE